jgi:hypothetical protein
LSAPHIRNHNAIHAQDAARAIKLYKIESGKPNPIGV